MASAYTLEFEKPLLELERQIDDLKRIGTERQIDIEGELQGLQGKLDSLRAEIYRNLTPIQRVMVARHPRRPYTLDYLSTIFTDFIELHGDRHFSDDLSIVGGLARFNGNLAGLPLALLAWDVRRRAPGWAYVAASAASLPAAVASASCTLASSTYQSQYSFHANE